MERESFEDLEIAEFLNRHYISIKLDREQSPDIDAIYMEAVNTMIGRGGWPTTILTTPEKNLSLLVPTSPQELVPADLRKGFYLF